MTFIENEEDYNISPNKFLKMYNGDTYNWFALKIRH